MIPDQFPGKTPVDDAGVKLSTAWTKWFAKVQNFFGVEKTFTPTFTGLTVVNGTGGATYAGTCTTVGRLVFVSVQISVTGTCTTAATAGTTRVTNLPLTVGAGGAVAAANGAGLGYGSGAVPAGGVALYAPTWAAYNGAVNLSGWYTI